MCFLAVRTYSELMRASIPESKWTGSGRGQGRCAGWCPPPEETQTCAGRSWCSRWSPGTRSSTEPPGQTKWWKQPGRELGKMETKVKQRAYSYIWKKKVRFTGEFRAKTIPRLKTTLHSGQYIGFELRKTESAFITFSPCRLLRSLSWHSSFKMYNEEFHSHIERGSKKAGWELAFQLLQILQIHFRCFRYIITCKVP